LGGKTEPKVEKFGFAGYCGFSANLGRAAFAVLKLTGLQAGALRAVGSRRARLSEAARGMRLAQEETMVGTRGFQRWLGRPVQSMRFRELAARALAAKTTAIVELPMDIVAFLRRCRFVPRESWQLPDEFEATRAGGCGDHALWAWRQCVALGEDARLTIGRLNGRDHTWVTLFDGGRPFVFEATSKDDRYLFRAREARAYEPRISIEKILQVYDHAEV
jgi:hypothetical protein